MKILVTGGCGFIGSNLVRLLVQDKGEQVINVDKLTYAGNRASLSDVESHANYAFEHADIACAESMREIFKRHQPDAVMHLAAESHVDRSIDGPGEFIQTNIIGTYTLLQAAREYFESLDKERRESFRFLNVSTDEVYGSLAATDPAFSETTAYDPHSPYSASKAAADHLTRAWGDTFGLPVIVTNCSNNYGAYQFPEKLIPVVILKCLRHEPIPVYGKGENVRDWLFVQDHAEALYRVVTRGSVGETYNIGGNNEWRNIDLVKMLCGIMDDLVDDAPVEGFASLITMVKDRPGHDMRYAINASKIRDELGWEPSEESESGFRKTVIWYLENQAWWEQILSGSYRLERQGKACCN
ncbi:dTDP-glucose 4,6-dehydratase [Cerasicoccus frondis]|uniref:dTDP-glucose 4,6-dehydratase n=1 Tax=Cerasicoccus frondis TaxID=490090 RepID=UPI0028524C0A|nr:dTDP-glucose 4,6-dehydratase [Cerasicoccus frondis]